MRSVRTCEQWDWMGWDGMGRDAMGWVGDAMGWDGVGVWRDRVGKVEVEKLGAE